MNSSETSWNGSNKLCSEWSHAAWMSSCRSSRETSVRVCRSLSLSWKNSSATMDDLFKRANNYSMLEDNVHTTTQQVLITNRSARHDHARNSKPSNQLRQASNGRDGQQQLNQASLTPLSISYEKLILFGNSSPKPPCLLMSMSRI